jgi:aminoglycoside phosphotransferase (APT) family kinase protein
MIYRVSMDSTDPARAAIEVPLVGDGVTQGIVRIGDTVRRPVRSSTASVHAFLAHLHARGFTGAPLPLGYDELGREVLTYVPGDVPREPLPDWATALPVLEQLARLVRRLHDAAEGFVPAAEAVWGGRAIHSLDGLRLVSHMDYCPGNVVFREGLPVALIDFDLARPTTRLADVVNALYWWAPLLHPLDRAPALVDADIPTRVAAFTDAYGMTAQQRAELVPFAVERAHDTHASARAAAQVDPVFRRFWDEGVKDRMPRAEAWWAENAAAVTAALGN